MVVESARQAFAALREDCDGSMLPIGAAGLLVLMAMVGSAVDLSRAYRAQQRLQAACDAGVLAGRRNVTSNGFNDSAQATAQRYFDNNFDPAKQESGVPVFNATTPDNGNTINATASATVDSAIMKIFGFAQFNLSASCAASMGVGNSDVTMVLDTTGSMDDPATRGASTSKLEDLQAAMKNFYATLRTATGSGNARIRYAFVPYSTTVNVGRMLFDLDPAYLTNTTPVQSRVPVMKTVSVQVFDHWGSPISSSKTSATENYPPGNWTNYRTNTYYWYNSCVSALPAESWANSGAATSSQGSEVNGSGQLVSYTVTRQPQTGTAYRCVGSSYNYYRQSAPTTRDVLTYSNVTVQNPVMRNEDQQEFDYWQYKQVNYDTSIFKTFATVNYPLGVDPNNGNGTGAYPFTWTGCVEERQTTTDDTFSYSTVTGISSGTRSDLDIDSPPDTSNPATQWRPLIQNQRESSRFPVGVAYARKDSYGRYTNSATTRDGSIASSPCPYQAQLFQIYPDQASFDAYADALTPGGNTYHDIGMIWGGRVSSPDGMWSSVVNAAPSNGGQVTRHLIFMTDGEMMPSSTVHSAYGVEWNDRRTTTTGIASTDVHNSRFLAVCEAIKAKGIRIWVIAFSSDLTTQLTTCASPDSSFLASDADELNNAFQQIALKVGELRVTQ